MKLPTATIDIQKCPDDLFQYLRKTFVGDENWSDNKLLTKEEAFLDQSYRYEAITKYFNKDAYFFSDVPPNETITEKIKPFTDYLLNEIFPGYSLFRCQLVCLKPGQNVYPHVDPRVYHLYGKRIHLPLQINEMSYHVHFLPEQGYDMRFAKMNEGVITDFDNITPHSAFNYGTTNRIHIICDILKSSIIGKIEEACDGNPNAVNRKLVEDYYIHLNKIEERYECKYQDLKKFYLEKISSL